MSGAILLTLVLFAAPAPNDAPEASDVTLHGTVITLPAALKPLGLAADPDPTAAQVVLKADDGTLTPLLSDEASRALFRDERLRNRRTEIRGRLYKGLPYLQVLNFRIEEEGRLRTPEYYCEICTISVRFPQTCPCCQGPMELRMKPEGR